MLQIYERTVQIPPNMHKTTPSESVGVQKDNKVQIPQRKEML